jgi:hypothetical protein
MSAPVAPVNLQQQLIDLIHQKTNESDNLEKNAKKLRADLIKAGREKRLLLDQQRNAISFAKIRKAKLIAVKEARLVLLESFEDRVELLKLVQKSVLERIKNLQELNPTPTVLAELINEQGINDDVTRELELAKKAVAQEKVEVANANRKVQEAESLEETALKELKSKVEKAQEATDLAAKEELSHGEKIISEFNEHNKAWEVICNQIRTQYGYVIAEDVEAINQLLAKQNQVFDKYITFFDHTSNRNQILQQTLPSLIEGIISADFMNRHDTFIVGLQEAVTNPPNFFYTTQHARRVAQKAEIQQFETDNIGVLQAAITALPPVNQRQEKINLVTTISNALRNEIVRWTQTAQERQSIANEKKSLAEVMQMELKNNVEQLKKALDLAIAEEKTQNEKFTEATKLWLQTPTYVTKIDAEKRALALTQAQESKAFLEQQLQRMEALLTQTTEHLKNIEEEVKLAQVEVKEVKALRIDKQKELIELQTDIENAASAKSATPQDKEDARNQELLVLRPLQNEYDVANQRDVNVARFTDGTITFLQDKIITNREELQQIKSSWISTKALAKLKEAELQRLMADPWLADAAIRARIQTLTAGVKAHNAAEEKLKAKAEDAQARLEDAESEIKKAQIKKYGLTADELYHLNVDAVLKEKLDILQQIRAVENQTPSQPNKVQELQLKLEEKEEEIFKIKKKIFLLSKNQNRDQYDLLKVRMLINSAAEMRYLVDNNKSSEKEVLLENLNNVLLEPLSAIDRTDAGSATALDPMLVAGPFDITNLETSLAALTSSQIKAAEAAIGVELAAKTAEMQTGVTTIKAQRVTCNATLSAADEGGVPAAARALATSLRELRNLEKSEAKAQASIQAVDVIKKIQPSTETWKDEITFFKNVIKTLLAKEWPEATNPPTMTRIGLGKGFSLEITGDDIVLAKEVNDAPQIIKRFAADLESISSTESATRIVRTQEEPLEHKEYFNFLSDLQDAIARKDPILDAERTKLIAEALVIDLPKETKEFAGSNLKNVTDEGYTFYKIRSGIFRIHGDSQRIDILGEDKIFHTAVSQFQLNEFLEKCHEPIVFEKINRNAYLEYPSDAKSIDIGGDFFLKNTVINNDQDRTDFLNADCFLLATQKFKLIKETGIKRNGEKFLNDARFARVKFETDFFHDVQPVGANFVKCYFDNVDFRQLTPETLHSLIFQDCKFGKDCLFPVGFKFGDQFRSSEKDPASRKFTIKNAKPPKDVPAIEIPDDKIHVIEVSKFASLSRNIPRA